MDRLKKYRQALKAFLFYKWPPGLLPVILAVVAAFASIIGLFGNFWWIFDLFAHFKIQYLFLLTLCFFVLLARKKTRKWSFCALPFIALNLYFILPFYLTEKRLPQEGLGRYKALALNVLVLNRGYERVKTLIKEKDPDFILLQEVDNKWTEAMAYLKETYPYFKIFPRDDSCGIAFYSKIKPEKMELLKFDKSDLPAVFADYDMNGRKLTIVGVHVLPPRFRPYIIVRNEQFDKLVKLAKSRDGGDVLLMGDLNSSHWSHDFKNFLHRSGLENSASGFGVQPSWPAFSVLFPLLIPIDHCLVSKGVAVLKRDIGPHVGSDHYPVLIEFSFAK
jgi:endonuclease/exonuclease/phosphatase (EEP) superfamily protein YafD